MVWHGNSSLDRCAHFTFWPCLDCQTLTVQHAGRQSPLQVGDRILSVNGQPVVGPLTFYQLNALFPPGDARDVAVDRAGQTVHLQVTLPPTHTPILARIYLGIALFILAVLALTLVHRPFEPAVLPFVASQGAIAVLVATPTTCTMSANLFFAPIFCLVAPLCFNLMVVVADDETLRQRLRVPRWALLGWGVVVSLYLIVERLAIEVQLPAYARIAHILDAVDMAIRSLNGWIVIGTLVAFFVLPLRWVRTLRARRKLQWLLWGMAAGACPYALGYYLPYLLGLIDGPAAHALMISLTVPFLVLMPLATAVAIVRYRLLDVEVVIDRSITGVATLLLLVPGLTLLVVRLGRWLFAEGRTPGLFYLTIPVAAAFAYLPVEGWVRRTIASWRRRFELDFGGAVEELLATLREAATRDEAIEKASLLLRRLATPESLLLVTADTGGTARHEWSTNVPADLVRRIEASPLAEVAAMLASGPTTPTTEPGGAARFRHVLPLRGPTEAIGLLALGDKVGEEDYAPRELQLAGIVADQLSLALRAFPAVEAAGLTVTRGGDEESAHHANRLLDLEREKEALQTLAFTDPLTGLCNRRQLGSAFESEAARALRTGEPLAVLMLDLDHFKRVNDTFGHTFGDRALRLVADTIRRHTRAGDTAARFGGEEFAILLPRADWDGAHQVAEKIRRAVQQDGAVLDDNRVGLTVSIGVASFAGRSGDAANEVLEEADRALYYAKGHGRNQSVLYADLPSRYRRPTAAASST